MYYLIFYPHIIGSKEGGSDGPQEDPDGSYSYPIIIKEFKINDIPVQKYENKEEVPENQNRNFKFASDLMDDKIHGYYISRIDELNLNYSYKGIFGLFEFDCESTGIRDYLGLNYNIYLDFHLIIGSSFKYEIILNGNKIEFSKSDFQYKINNGKIIFDGYIDEYDEQKYIALKKKDDPDFDINEESERSRLWRWLDAREAELIPRTMKIV